MHPTASLDMTRIAKAWDFLWGVLIIGALPVLAFMGVGVLGGLLGFPFEDGLSLIAAVVTSVMLVAPMATLYFACRWRKRHRRLPAWVFRIELLLGVILGVAFLGVLMVATGFANIS
jgi:heme/copper-type cytochrome/quinol oxidase subunit 3